MIKGLKDYQDFNPSNPLILKSCSKLVL